jgi:hypothetical protein
MGQKLRTRLDWRLYRHCAVTSTQTGAHPDNSALRYRRVLRVRLIQIKLSANREMKMTALFFPS